MSKPIGPVLALATATVLFTATLGRAMPQAGSTASKSTASTVHKTATAAPHTIPSLLNPASLKLQAPDVFDAKFVTTKGDFVVEVTRRWSPRGADRFYSLVKYHFFDNAAFFRVMQGFVAQFGVSPRPDVNRAWENARLDDDSVTQSNLRGTLTFATAGPNTRTTQIFINLGDNTNLDAMGFSPFGKIVSGLEVVDKLYSGYGDGPPDGQGPDQNQLQREGKPYLDRNFPSLDVIKTTLIVPPAPVVQSKPPTATSKPAAPSK
jgi:peptidyl-prolyl cis-trans isomerase A (cyclophilin A)